MQKFRAKSFSPLGHYYMEELIPVINHHWQFVEQYAVNDILENSKIFFSCILLLEKKDYVVTWFSTLAKKIFDFSLPIWISLECIQISSSSMAHETGQWTFQKQWSAKERRYFVVPFHPAPIPDIFPPQRANLTF